jgi:uncharacterized protein involved in exopolysaccharide biosynthesis
MTLGLFLRRYWRIPLVAVLAAVLAFGASFVEKPSYRASTRLLLVEGSTSLLTSSGQVASSPYGVDSATSAQTLSETQAGLASSRAVATIVVDKLHLDAPKPAKHGVIHSIEGAAASMYAHLKAFLTAGFYKVPPRREAAIQATEASIVATDLAPSGGPDTGQTDSYILELDASANTATLAARIANTAASALIQVSQQDFAQSSQYWANALAAQLHSADAALAAANSAVTNYELAHHISSIDQQLAQNAQISSALNSQLISAEAAVNGDEKTVASLQSSLATTDPTEQASQSVVNGRSTTADNTTQANPVYQTLEESLSQAKAAEARDRATVTSLQGQAGVNPSASLTQAQAGLLDLEQVASGDQDSVQSLSKSLQQAQSNVNITPVEITQLGTANTPNYPSSPKRDLYLMLGLLLGVLAGSGLTHLARRRAPLDPDDEDEAPIGRTAEFEYRASTSAVYGAELVGAGANGHNRRASDIGNGIAGTHLNGSGLRPEPPSARSNGHDEALGRPPASDLYPPDAPNGPFQT